MGKRDYFLVLDTETTQNFPAKYDNAGNLIREGVHSQVADFGAVVIDRKGNEYARCAVLVAGVFGELPLFYTSDSNDAVFGKHTLDTRMSNYSAMLESGQRMLASVNAINRWLDNVRGKYNPYLTAYNLAFDRDKCHKTGIDLTNFVSREFCLWYAAADKWAQTRKYREFILDNHLFNTPTELKNMSYKTNAETMARFVLGNADYPDEPHTALEDVLYYEIPVLLRLLSTVKKRVWLNPPAYSWRNLQVKNHFRV